MTFCCYNASCAKCRYWNARIELERAVMFSRRFFWGVAHAVEAANGRPPPIEWREHRVTIEMGGGR